MELENAALLICELHEKDGAVPIGKMDKPWFRKIDDRWSIWVSGQTKPADNGNGVEILPGDVYIEFNGFPAGIFSMIRGDGMLAAGELANYETFCDALRAAVNS